MDGNRAYVSGHVKFDDLAALRHESAPHQRPPYTILSCADSRVPPELIFDKSIDSLFVIRVAGNVTGTDEIASIEYAIASGYTKLIVVMGHAECGAVRAALSPDKPASPALAELVAEIQKSFGSMKHGLDPATVKRAVELNTKASADALLAKSKIIRDAVRSGKAGLVVAYYDLESGKVERLK